MLRLGVNAQLAACVSVMILVIETIVILPSITIHFNHTLTQEVERQLMLHHLAEYDSDLARLPASTPTPTPTLVESANELYSEASDALYSETSGGANPYISIHNDRNLVAQANAHQEEGVWAVVASLSGWREEWHVKHFAMTEFVHMPLFSAPTSPLAFTDPSDLDDMHVRLAVPPDFMREALVGHAIERGALVLGVLLLAVVAFYLLVQCKVIRPLRQILDRITHLTNHVGHVGQDVANNKTTARTILDDAHATLAQLDQQSGYHLAQREKLVTIGEAVAKINHDMRNVLSAATLVTDRLVSSKDPQVATAAPRVTGAINRAVELCQQMLTYINTPQKLNLAPTNMKMLVAEVRQALAIAVDYFGPEELCVDGGQFFRLVFNLVDNAKKAGANSVILRAQHTKHTKHTGQTEHDGGIAIDIVDDGPGMDATTKGRLFKPFQSKNGSSGLGLSIARDIALIHGGGLCLVRTSKRGSVFRLRLPPQVLVGAKAKADNKGHWWRG